MSVVAEFDYFERGSTTARSDLKGDPSAITRAEAAIKVDKQANAPRCLTTPISAGGRFPGPRHNRRLHGHLTRQEQDLVDLPFNTLLLGQVAAGPGEPKKGPPGNRRDASLAMLLGLDAVSRTDVETC